MSTYIFNDISMERFYNDFESFMASSHEMVLFYQAGKRYGHTVYIHTKTIGGIQICNCPFRRAINDTKISNEFRKLIMTIIDKSSPALPDDSAIPDNINFVYNTQTIPNTGLAECAYQQMMGEIVSSYSLSNSSFKFDSLSISILQNGSLLSDETINNYFSLEVFENEIQITKPINSWDDFIDYVAGQYSSLELTEDAKKNMRRETFEVRLGKAVIKRLEVLDKMINSESNESFLQLHREYCEGDRAWFSDESDTRKRELKDKLTFPINGKEVPCSYHGKVNMRTFRIHLSSSPKRGEKIFIAYIGGKIL